MKTKTFNHFRNLFAFVGFFIIACSAAVELDSPEESPVVQNNNGKYQVSYFPSSKIVVLNTENGKMRTYRIRDTKWVEDEYPEITFTH